MFLHGTEPVGLGFLISRLIMTVNVLVLRAPGTNCDLETAYAFERCGARAERLHVNQLLAESKRLADFQVLCLPGGFSYGDDIASGRILGNQLKRNLGSALGEFKAAGKLILGICNGFQVLMNCGLLWEQCEYPEPPATLAWNESGRYTDRWVELCVDHTPCVFLNGIKRLPLPIAHGEGRFTTRTPKVLQQFQEAGQLAIRYTNATSEILDTPLPFPLNPNGAMANVAGMCDVTGRVFGLMPHPERYIDRTQHPRWTRGEGSDPGMGLQLFANAVHYFR